LVETQEDSSVIKADKKIYRHQVCFSRIPLSRAEGYSRTPQSQTPHNCVRFEAHGIMNGCGEGSLGVGQRFA
ncbi:protein o-mannosyl transferase, partial [Moniliophthora roreri]